MRLDRVMAGLLQGPVVGHLGEEARAEQTARHSLFEDGISPSVRLKPANQTASVERAESGIDIDTLEREGEDIASESLGSMERSDVRALLAADQSSENTTTPALGTFLREGEEDEEEEGDGLFGKGSPMTSRERSSSAMSSLRSHNKYSFFTSYPSASRTPRDAVSISVFQQLVIF